MSQGTRTPLRLRDFVEQAQSEGRYTFSLTEAAAAVAVSSIALQSSIRRLKRAGRIVSPHRGFFVIVPPEYRSTEAPPASWFIDDLMRFLGRPYYVGLLTAAAIHGASHQQPQVFHVMTSRPMKAGSAGRVQLRFFKKRNIGRASTVRLKTETGSMNVSTPEATVFDLIRHVRSSGHFSNIANVYSELGEIIDADRLRESASQATQPEIQRAGYLLQLVGHDALANALDQVLCARRKRAAWLAPKGSSDTAPFDERWQLFINERVEPDL